MLNNGAYWHKRMAKIFDNNYVKRDLKRIYTKSYASLESKIVGLYNELQEVDVLTANQLYQYEKYRNLLDAIDKQTGNIKSNVDTKVFNALTSAYEESFNRTLKEFGENNFTKLNPKMIETAIKTDWNGGNFSKRIWDNTNALARQAKANVATCLVEGTSKDTFVKTMQKQFGKDFSCTDRVMRTELSHAINTAQVEGYKKEGVTRVQWYAAEDERMCDLCGDLHGQIFNIDDIGDDVEAIAHPNCRCTLIPIIEGVTNDII